VTTKGDWHIYPNPASGRVFVKGPTGDIKAEITSVDGRTMLRSNAVDHGGLNISHLAPGAYFIRLTQADGAALSAPLLIHR
jgi:hypothetical protein